MQTTNQATKALWSAYRASSVHKTEFAKEADKLVMDGCSPKEFLEWLGTTNQNFGYGIGLENVRPFVYWLEDQLL